MDPNRLYQNINAIMKFLFDREEAHLARRETDIITHHAMLGGSRDGFRHMGRIYSPITGAGRPRGVYDRLHPSLVPEMGSITTARKILELDRSRIQQALFLVLKDARTNQDMRDALPNCLRDLIPACKGLERTREEAYTLRDNPRAYSQYMMLRDKIEFYVAARLLY
jgi:hypothetical protein